MGRLTIAAREVTDLVRHPARLRNVARSRSWRRLGRQLLGPAGGSWQEAPTGDFNVRRYESYDAYVGHQSSKLGLFDLSEYDAALERALTARLDDGDWQGRSVVCLAARLGGEVRAFANHGAFAVGVDLNPGPGNRLVLHGDFHALQFADNSVDACYTNSLDHSLRIADVAGEVHRILKPGGVFVLETMRGTEEGNQGFADWEATSWTRVDAVIDLFTAAGFRETGARLKIDFPWEGVHTRLTKAADQRLVPTT